MKPRSQVFVHPTAEVSAQARLGAGTRVWHHAQVREGAVIGEQCILGKGVYVGRGVRVGDRCKLQNGALLYQGVELEEGVFIGPLAVLSNDRYPRAITPEGSLKGEADWELLPVRVRYGASVGAGALILPGVTVGRFALVAAGAVVTHDVPDHGWVAGVPARLRGYVCRCGRPMQETPGGWHCGRCDWWFHPAEGRQDEQD